MVGFTVFGNNTGDKVLTQDLSESLGDATAAKFEFNVGTGNLTIDQLASGEGLLASGALEYLEKQDPPAWTVDAQDSQATLLLKGCGGRQPGFRLPWAACNGETNWQIHLNPVVSSDITAHSGGGNVKIDLTGMTLTRVSADSGGGNLDMILPDGAPDLSVTAKTGGATSLSSSAAARPAAIPLPPPAERATRRSVFRPGLRLSFTPSLGWAK